MTDAMTEAIAAPQTGKRIHFGSPVYNEIHEFLIDEAALLDNFRLMEWLGCMAPDLVYQCPQRVTRMRADKLPTVVYKAMHFDDNIGSLSGRVIRIVNTKSAWTEDPPSRTRRLVTNVAVHASAAENEYEVVSYLLLMRSRQEAEVYEQLSCERRDRLRKTSEGWKIARRDIILDQSVLGMSNLAVFL